MSEKTGSLYYESGFGGSQMSAQILARNGKSGRDDPLRKGRVHIFPYSWPLTIDTNNGLYGHILTQAPQGPFGPTVHHNMLDGLRVVYTASSDGTPYIQSIHPTDTNSQEGSPGENVYSGAHAPKGK
jgi:hypothetical protein